MIGLFGRPLPVSCVQVSPRVGRLPQAAARPAAVEAPRRPPALIRRGEQDVRVRRIHHDIGEAGVVVDELRIRPGLAAVGRLVEAALAVRPEQVPERGDVDDVRILRVDDDAADASACPSGPRSRTSCRRRSTCRRRRRTTSSGGCSARRCRRRRCRGSTARSRCRRSTRPGSVSKIGVQVVPLFVVFQTPPVASRCRWCSGRSRRRRCRRRGRPCWRGRSSARRRAARSDRPTG